MLRKGTRGVGVGILLSFCLQAAVEPCEQNRIFCTYNVFLPTYSTASRLSFDMS